jgi:spore maturation protein CgeB
LKILVLGTTQEDTAAGSIARAFALSHDVVNFDYARGFRPLRGKLERLNSGLHLALKAARRPQSHFANRRLLSWIEGRSFDLVFIIAISLVPAEVVRALRDRTGALVVAWFTDHIGQMKDGEFVAAPYHRVFLKDRTVVERFRAALATKHVEFLPQAFDPTLHRPAPERFAPEDAGVDVATFGNSYLYRAVMMGPLLAQRDIRTVIYGSPSWDPDKALLAAYRPPIYGLRKSAAMRAAAIALNTNHPFELGGVNKRSFELGGAGAFQLTDGPRIAEYFEPGVECATFRGPEDLVDKVRHYLGRPEERAELARRGLFRAFREHTYQHRLNELMDRVPELRGAARLPVPAGPPEPEDGIVGDGREVPIRTEW